MRLTLHTGVWIGSVGLWITGGLAMTSATVVQIATFYIGEVAILAGVLLFIWGIKWDGRHWWSGSSPSPRDIPTAPPAQHRPINRWLQESWEDAQIDRRAKREADRQSKSKPERDVALSEALAFIANGAWGGEFSLSISAKFQQAAVNPLRDFRQRAFESKIAVWGHLNPSDIYREIPAEHWSDHEIDPGALLNRYARTWGHDKTNYGHLMVNRAQIEKEWPNEG